MTTRTHENVAEGAPESQDVSTIVRLASVAFRDVAGKEYVLPGYEYDYPGQQNLHAEITPPLFSEGDSEVLDVTIPASVDIHPYARISMLIPGRKPGVLSVGVEAVWSNIVYETNTGNGE